MSSLVTRCIPFLLFLHRKRFRIAYCLPPFEITAYPGFCQSLSTSPFMAPRKSFPDK
jgi:hypothetical protein